VPLERFAGEPSQANVFIDVVAVDAELAASLQAAEELLQAARRGVFRTEESKLNSFLAKELDYFWRRLTRFPKVGAGRPAEAVQPV
jgi:hypothetical protein